METGIDTRFKAYQVVRYYRNGQPVRGTILEIRDRTLHGRKRLQLKVRVDLPNIITDTWINADSVTEILEGGI